MRDLRISMGDVLGWLAEGQTAAQIAASRTSCDSRAAEQDRQARMIHLALGNTCNDAVLAAQLSCANRLRQAFDDPATGVVVLT